MNPINQNSDPSYIIRLATSGDKTFLLSLIPRLVEFGPPAWRKADEMVAFDTSVLNHKLEHPQEGTMIFIAENQEHTPLGFIHIQFGHDYYYKKPHAHIEDLIIAPDGEGKGIASLLIHQAESWAREQGFSRITLNVFAQNSKARKIYEHLGYGQDILKYVKPL